MQVKATAPLLEKLPIDFVGNVEPTDAMAGACDVLVCDGFVGNILLKAAEGAVETVISLLREEIVRAPERTTGGLAAPGCVPEIPRTGRVGRRRRGPAARRRRGGRGGTRQGECRCGGRCDRPRCDRRPGRLGPAHRGGVASLALTGSACRYKTAADAGPTGSPHPTDRRIS